MWNRILYVYMYTGYIMAKLYWRYKKNGKWTWTPAKVVERAPWRNQTTVEDSKEVEQEWHHFGERSGSINAKNVGERIRRYQATVLVHGVITHGEEMETLWMLRQVAWDWSTEETRFTSKAWERWTVSRVHQAHATKRALANGEDLLYNMQYDSSSLQGSRNRKIVFQSVRKNLGLSLPVRRHPEDGEGIPVYRGHRRECCG